MTEAKLEANAKELAALKQAIADLNAAHSALAGEATRLLQREVWNCYKWNAMESQINYKRSIAERDD
jgi:maltooligosyltrehalose synthase